MAAPNYEDKVNNFFKAFEIPSLWDIHLLKSVSLDWSQMEKPPSFDKKSSVRLHYQSLDDAQRKEYILFITQSSGIYSYDLSSNTISQLTEYPADLKCRGAEIELNRKTADLYFVGGMDKCFAIYNLARNEWDIKCLSKDEDHEKSLRYDINSVDNQPRIIDNILYINGWNASRYFDAEKDRFVDLDQVHSSAAPSSGNDTKMVYHPYLNSYIHFGSDSTYYFSAGISNEIWLFGTTETNPQCEWHMFINVKLPSCYDNMTLRHVLSWKSVAILVYFSKDLNASNNDNQVWCLDLEQEKWSKAKASLPLDEVSSNEGDYDLVVTQNGELHAFTFCYEEKNKHVKLSLSDLFDDGLTAKFFGQKFVDLVNGYMRELVVAHKEIEKTDLSTPLSLIQAYYFRGLQKATK